MVISSKSIRSVVDCLPYRWFGMLLVALLVFLPTASMSAPGVTWNPAALSATVVPGSSISTSATFTANKDLSNVEIRVVPELKPFLTVSPTSFGFLSDGESRVVDITMSVPSGTSPGSVDGTVHIMAAGGGGNATVAKPLPVDLNIQQASSATLTIRTLEDEEGLPPGPAGTIIRIDGQEVGVTGADGTLTVQVVPGPRDVVAFIRSDRGARESVDLAPGANETLDLVLKSTKLPLLEDYDLIILEAQSGILPQDFASLTLVFRRPDGSPIALDLINGLTLTGIAQGSASEETGGGQPITDPVRLDEFFALAPDGLSIIATDVEGLRTVLSAFVGQVQIYGIVSNLTEGMVYETFATMNLGRFTINGQLSPPPSNPTLPVDAIPVKLNLLGTNIELEILSDVGGALSFTSLPFGSVNLRAETEDSGIVYSGAGITFMDADKDVTINLLTTIDVINGEPQIIVTNSAFQTNLAFTLDMQDEAASQSADRTQIAQTATVPQVTQAAAAGTQVSVSVAGAARNVTVTDTATLEVPAETESLTMRYTVTTQEYPVFVLAQSIFNDTWDIDVRAASGTNLFNIARNVNSQLRTAAPLWRTDGSTGEIVEQLDLTTLPLPSGPTRMITITARTQNIGDGILPTFVNATLSADPALAIKVVQRVKTHISIPRNGQNNNLPNPGTNLRTHHIQIPLRITGPTPPPDVVVADINNLKTDMLLGSTGGAGQHRIVDQGSVTGPASSSSDKEFDVEVTFGRANTMASPANGVPPEAHNLQYKIEVTAPVGGTDQMTDATSAGHTALWKMPDGFARYSVRDRGGDEWSAKGTYEWMVANGPLINTRIYDVSGEHGRNIGHTTHRRGTDIDIYLFGQDFSPVQHRASTNYAQAQSLTNQALNGDAAAEATITAWFAAQRAGVQALVANADVAQVRALFGTAFGVLPDGWAQSLFATGSVTGTNSVTLSIGGGLTNAKIVHDNTRNNHHHIDLNDRRLNNSP